MLLKSHKGQMKKMTMVMVNGSIMMSVEYLRCKELDVVVLCLQKFGFRKSF